MKNKILLIVVAIAMLFTITGCGKTETYKLGDTVETDVVKIQLLGAKYTYALNRTMDSEYALPKEYNADEDNGNPYVAGKGNTLASFEFYIENMDRSSVDVGGAFNDTFITVNFDGKTYENEVEFIGKSEDYINWESNLSDNILLLAGKKGYYRGYMNIDTDVKNLDQAITIEFHLPNSEGKTDKFIFNVTPEDRTSFKGVEISLDTAIKNFRKKVANEYFQNHMSEYTKITGDEITTAINGRKYNVSENGWEGTFKFEESKKIYEGGNKYAVGYTNKRSWKVEDNKLVLSWVTSKGETKSNYCEVYLVKEGTYLLVEDSKPFGILY